MFKILFVILCSLLLNLGYADNSFAIIDLGNKTAESNIITSILSYVSYILKQFVLLKIGEIPIIIIWIIGSCIYFTIQFNFVNIKLFRHSFQILLGNYHNPKDIGEISTLRAFFTAVSGAVGLGNIVGVAIGIQMGGPGAIFWMMVSAFFIMSIKFIEVAIGHKYRERDAQGNIIGGPFIYIRKCFEERFNPKHGARLATIFAILYLLTSLGGGTMFQANQAIAIIENSIPELHNSTLILAVILSVLTAIVTIGGLKTISLAASAIVPIMTSIYVISCIVIISFHYENFFHALNLIWYDAFHIDSISGGIVTTIVIGIQRAAFASEAGIGSSSIEHAAAQTKEHIREGCAALMEPFIGTMIICFLTGIILIITDVYEDNSLHGILIAEQAFSSVSEWFTIFLMIAAPLFAFSTIITNSYHAERAWIALWGTRSVMHYRLLFVCIVFLSCFIDNFSILLDFCDCAYLLATLPNIAVLYLYTQSIKDDLQQYHKKYNL